MTQSNFTGATITVTSSIGGQQTWELVVADEINPMLTKDVTKSDRIYFTNDDFNAVVTIEAEFVIGKPPGQFAYLLNEGQARAMGDTDRYIYSGYLQADDDWCVLCHDQRHITVRVVMPLTDVHVIVAATEIELSQAIDALKHGTQDIDLPCPACRIPEYLLAKDDYTPGVDS
jgi:hypothetical protein